MLLAQERTMGNMGIGYGVCGVESSLSEGRLVGLPRSVPSNVHRSLPFRG